MEIINGYKLDEWISNEVYYTQSILLESSCKIWFPYFKQPSKLKGLLFSFGYDSTHYSSLQKYNFGILFPLHITEDEPVYYIVYKQLMSSITKKSNLCGTNFIYKKFKCHFKIEKIKLFIQLKFRENFKT